MTSRKGRVAALGFWAAAILPFASPLAAQSANGVGSPFELAFWQSVAGSEDPAVYDAYLQQYPSGTFAGLARAKAASLRKAVPVPATQAAIPTPPSPTLPSPTPPSQNPATTISAAAHPEPAQVSSDAALLTELARSQEPGASTSAVASAQGFALPPRPALTDVSDLALPASFCSTEQRNAFYELRYKPLLELARGNNAAAIAHMQKLQQAYDSYQLSRDPSPMNALAAEARDYQQQVAALTYSRQAAVVRQFDAIMALPIAACAVTVAAK